MVLRKEVLRFAEEMERQLEANDEKGSLDELIEEDADFLWSELRNHLASLRRSLGDVIDPTRPRSRHAVGADLETVRHESADVANFLMMLALVVGE